jgi:hypothetical protein
MWLRPNRGHVKSLDVAGHVGVEHGWLVSVCHQDLVKSVGLVVDEVVIQNASLVGWAVNDFVIMLVYLRLLECHRLYQHHVRVVCIGHGACVTPNYVIDFGHLKSKVFSILLGLCLFPGMLSAHGD